MGRASAPVEHPARRRLAWRMAVMRDDLEHEDVEKGH
jgi:hypothetical protein